MIDGGHVAALTSGKESIKLAIIGSNTHALAERVRQFQNIPGYTLLPIIITTPETKAAYCATGDTITRLHVEDHPHPTPCDNLLGCHMAASRDDVMAYLRRMSPDAAIVMKEFGPKQRWMDSDAVLTAVHHASKHVKRHMTKFYDVESMPAMRPEALSIHAVQRGFHLVGRDDSDEIDYTIQRALTYQRVS